MTDHGVAGGHGEEGEEDGGEDGGGGEKSEKDGGEDGKFDHPPLSHGQD